MNSYEANNVMNAVATLRNTLTSVTKELDFYKDQGLSLTMMNVLIITEYNLKLAISTLQRITPQCSPDIAKQHEITADRREFDREADVPFTGSKIPVADGATILSEEFKILDNNTDYTVKAGSIRYCSVCCEEQVDSPAGITCPLGHGGAPSITSFEVTQRKYDALPDDNNLF